MRSVLEVALYFLYCIDRDAEQLMSPLKLQKLVYYGQAWSLVFQDQPLFQEEIQAWTYGPVVHEVWSRYQQYRHKAIPEPDEALPQFLPDEIEVLEEVWNAYGDLDVKRLDELVRSELPWLNARKGLDPAERSYNVISHQDMKAYYSSLLVEV